jgi:hypothetical protein
MCLGKRGARVFMRWLIPSQMVTAHTGNQSLNKTCAGFLPKWRIEVHVHTACTGL